MGQTVMFFVVAFLAAIVILFVIRGMSRGRGPHWAVVILVLVLAGNVAFFGDRYERKVETDRQTAAILKDLDANPVMLAVKDADPGVYADIRQQVVDTAVFPADERAAKAKALAAPILDRMVKQRVQHLDDTMLMETIRLTTDVLKAKMRQDPGRCEMVDLSQDPAKLVDLLGFERVRQYTLDLLRSSPGPAHPPVTSEQTRAAVLMVMMGMAQRSGLPFEQFAQAMAHDSGDKCAMAVRMFEYVEQLPNSEAAPLVRAISAGRLG